MTTRDILILLLVIVLVSHFFGLPWMWGGPIGLVLLILIVLAVMGTL
jgi:hypothetical protein